MSNSSLQTIQWLALNRLSDAERQRDLAAFALKKALSHLRECQDEVDRIGAQTRQDMLVRLCDAVREEPGNSISYYASRLQFPKTRLRTVTKQAMADGFIRSAGKMRNTVYHPTKKSAAA